jgi:protein phosphatase
MQALGTQPNVRVVMTTVQLYRNDYVLLCSDGLSNKIESDEMQEIIEDTDDLQSASSQMVEIANQRGGEDNITVIIARFDGKALRTISESVLYTDNFSTLRKIEVEEEREVTAKLTSVTESESAAAARQQTQTEQIADPAPIAAELQATQETKEQWPRASAHVPKKRSFAPIIIYTALALILIGFTAYFAYRYFQKPEQIQITPPEEKPVPPPSEQPQETQPGVQSQPQSEPPPQDQPSQNPSENTNLPQSPPLARPAPGAQPQTNSQ